ncbi:hypothetical protein PybrP1_011097 [[Pythium] brassicae (nom. inval.)]|nr:hypothetical protein PybrP1_011097 [[Pythium] brassicae (nom. inval.)]
MYKTTKTAAHSTRRGNGAATMLTSAAGQDFNMWANLVSSEGVPVSAVALQLKAPSDAQDEDVRDEVISAS